jgi:hypothetical protein
MDNERRMHKTGYRSKAIGLRESLQPEAYSLLL